MALNILARQRGKVLIERGGRLVWVKLSKAKKKGLVKVTTRKPKKVDVKGFNDLVDAIVTKGQAERSAAGKRLARAKRKVLIRKYMLSRRRR